MDEKTLLEAISQMMDAKLAEQRKEITADIKALREEVTSEVKALREEVTSEVKALRKEIMQDVKVLLDTEVQTKFNLLAEGQEEILRRMPSEEDMDIIEGRLADLEAIAKRHTREIAALKQAN